MRQTPTALLLVLVAFTNLYFQNGGQVNSPPPAKDSVESLRAPIEQSRLHNQRVSSRHCADIVQCVLDEMFKGEVNWKDDDFSTEVGQKHIRFLIATLPDPKHTHLAMMFDRLIEGLQSAAEQERFVFDRARLVPPWQERGTSTEIRPDQDRLLVEQVDDFPEQPGLLVFRKHEDEKEDEYIITLLVGENPTAGINAVQFSRAIQIALHTGNNIGIIGPTFSGSFDSLNRLLAQNGMGCPKRTAPFLIVRSGSATSESEAAWFRKRNACHASVMSFADGGIYLYHQFLQFARSQKFKPNEIATLAEDETAYGSDPTVSSDHPLELDDEPMTIYFPRGISVLRSAYQEESSVSRGEDAGVAPRTTLPPDFATSGEDDDTVTTFDPKHTSLSQEGVLQEIFRTLRDHQTKIVLIKATDVMDTLFLAGQLRKNYPEARLVSYGADLLARRDLDDPTLRGMMSLTSYPLMPGWVTEILHTPHVHRVFPATEQVGEFNAMLDVIRETNGPPARGFENLPPRYVPQGEYAQYVSPDTSDVHGTNQGRPWLWLTAVGSGGFWPVAAFDPQSSKPGDVPSPSQLSQEARSQPTRLSGFNLLVLFVLALVSGAFLYSTWKGALDASASSVAQHLAPIGDRRRTALCCFAGMALMAAWFLLLINVWSILPCSILAASILANCYVRVGYGANTPYLRKEACRSVILAATVLVLACLVVLGASYFAAPSAAKTPWINLMFLYRANHLDSGLAPNLPFLLICAALLWWSWYMLKSESLFDLRRSLLPRGNGIGLPSHDKHGNAGSSRTLWFTTNFLLFALSFLVLRFVVLSQFNARLQSLEGKSFDWVCEIAFTLGFLFLLNSIYAALVYWLRCRRLLADLDRTPLRYGFRDIKGFSWQRIRSLGGADISFAYRPLMRSIQCFDRLYAVMDKDERDLCAVPFNRIEEDFNSLRQQLDPGPRALIRHSDRTSGVQLTLHFNQKLCEGIGSLQIQLSILCAIVYRCILIDYWKSHDRRWVTREPAKYTENDNTDAGLNRKSDPSDKTPEKVQWAEEFVALNYIAFVLRSLIHIRWLLVASLGIYVFLFFGATLYPFEPQTSIHAFFIFVFLGMFSVVAVILAQMHKNDALSHLTDTKPGELGVDFWIRIVSFAAVPMVTLITTQVPGLNRILFFWVKPLLNGLNKGG